MSSSAIVLGSSLINKILLFLFCESKFNASGLDFFYNVALMSKCRNPLFIRPWFKAWFFVLSLKSVIFRSAFLTEPVIYCFFIIFLIHLLTFFAIFCFISPFWLSVFEEARRLPGWVWLGLDNTSSLII